MSIKYLFCKHEDLSLSLRTHIKNRDVGVHACNPYARTIQKGYPWDSLSICLAYMLGSRQVRDPYLQQGKQE